MDKLEYEDKLHNRYWVINKIVKRLLKNKSKDITTDYISESTGIPINEVELIVKELFDTGILWKMERESRLDGSVFVSYKFNVYTP
jgi:hypothetical protein